MVESGFKRLIFWSRWLMTPFYLGLLVVLLALLVKFVEELLHFVPHIMELSETDVILISLSLIDLTLVASLVLMMVFSGFENFVARLDTSDERRPAWLGALDFSGLKLKLIASIVAISGIHLLKSFMNVRSADKTELMWLVITHMTFVVSGVLLALMDLITGRAGKAYDKA